MSIHTRTVHRVEVVIPDDVWTRYGESVEFDRMSCEATSGSDAAGQDRISGVIEWAEFPYVSAAQACDKKLMDMVAHFQGKLIIDNKKREREDKADEIKSEYWRSARDDAAIKHALARFEAECKGEFEDEADAFTWLMEN